MNVYTPTVKGNLLMKTHDLANAGGDHAASLRLGCGRATAALSMGKVKGNDLNAEAAAAFAEKLRPMMFALRARSSNAAAQLLNAWGIEAPRGSAEWQAQTVINLRARLGMGPRWFATNF